MINNRYKLHTRLKELFDDCHIYFQPPSSVKMKYPAIVYDYKRIDNRHANNAVYNRLICYEVILIDEDPDNENLSKFMELSKCTFDRHYTSDNLNHYVFTLYN